MRIDTNRKLDVFGIGNALVDTLVFVDDDFLKKANINKSVMTLASGEEQSLILGLLKDYKLELRSGGSAANSMWAISQCGGKTAYTGVVSDDPNGEFYKKDLESNQVEFEIEPVSEHHGPTGTCIVMTTPDAERTMSTHLGVSVKMEKKFIDTNRLKESKFIYVEGYLWDGKEPKDACLHAMDIARNSDVIVSFSFSDPFCVDRYRDEFRKLVKDQCDVIFCNAQEACIFSGSDSLTEAATNIGKLVDHVFVTNGKDGCLVVDQGNQKIISGFPVEAVDTNGAGDAFAGGVLHALCQGRNTFDAARWGNYLASQIVNIHGARLVNNYQKHFIEILGD